MDAQRRKDCVSSITLIQEDVVSVNGRQLRTARIQTGLTVREVVARMAGHGWGYYPAKVFRIESTVRYMATRKELEDYIDSLASP